MQKRTLACMAAVGCAAAIAIPSIALGNARSNTSTTQAAQTPYVARLTGASAETPPGEPLGIGGAAVTFDITNPLSNTDGATVCWDLSYSGLTGTVTASHIHRGAAGTNGNIVLPFGNITATGATGCAPVGAAVLPETVGGGILATQIEANPAGFYVNVHTTTFPAGAIRGQLAAGPPPAGEAHLLPAPLRAYDSRDLDGPIALNTTRTVSLATGKDSANATVLAVPPGATGAIVTLTVTDTSIANSPGGFLKLYTAALGTPPSTSSINWTGAGQNLAVTTQVAVDASGRVKITDGANPTNFVVDVIGYLF